MQTAINNWILKPELSAALYYTFLHSLWQGLLAAILGAIILMCARRASSSLRYHLLLSVFFLFLAGTIFTFNAVWHQASAVSLNTTPSVNNAGSKQVIFAITPAIESPGVIRQVLTGLVNYSSLLLNIWLIVFAYKLIKISIDLYSASRMRNYRTTGNLQWQERMLVLAGTMGIRRKVLLLESAVAKLPMTIGFLKPVVLVPAGFFTGLSAIEVEAVLRHELAHIRRLDYLVNLLQCFAGVIFFFNPGLLWISSLIRREREYCCDDIAMTGNTDKKNYIKALVAAGEYNHSMQTAMSFAAVKGHLMNRVKRILNNENGKPGMPEKSVLVLGVIGMVITLVALKPVQKNSSGAAGIKEKNVAAAVNHISLDTFYVSVKKLAANKSGYRNYTPAIVRDTVPKPSLFPKPPITPKAPATPEAPWTQELKDLAEENAAMAKTIIEKINVDSISKAVMLNLKINKALIDSAVARANKSRQLALKEQMRLSNDIQKKIKEIRITKDTAYKLQNRIMLQLQEQINFKELDSTLRKELAKLSDLDIHFKMVPQHFEFNFNVPEFYFSSPDKVSKEKLKKKQSKHTPASEE